MSSQSDTPIRFTTSELELFSAASRDHNPLHMSAVYARSTPYGQPVVFGVLGLVKCLGRLRERPDHVLAGVRAEFSQPAFVGVDYEVKMVEVSTERAEIQVLDGRRVVTKATVTFRPGRPRAWNWADRSSPVPAEVQNIDDSGLDRPTAIERVYPAPKELIVRMLDHFALGSKGIGGLELCALLSCSFVVGMELPGLRALFFKLNLAFEEGSEAVDTPLAYSAAVAAFDKRFDLLKLDYQFSCETALLATGKLESFVRRPIPARNEIPIGLPPASGPNSKVALVVGGSRGLGAALVRVLARDGFTVLLNYQMSQAEAEALRDSLLDCPGKTVLLQGDAADVSWCEGASRDIAAQYERLDLLVCNACPSLLPLWLEPAAARRINDYLLKSFALVSGPMSAFAPLLARSSGWGIVISSQAVNAPPSDWPHYVSAKCAVEGLTRVAAAEYSSVSFLIVRPPQLLTDLTNTPMGRHYGVEPSQVAVKILGRLKAPPFPGRVEVMEDFSPPVAKR
jgi:NAD(P)-dependent dehydrogenase (short-subunit alcohol dehydrogenase family)/acyl dehydratase